jgi:sulfite exporter TauE/SafE
MVTQSALLGSFFKTVFGLGTLPVMFTIYILGQIINLKFNQKANFLIPVFLLFCVFVYSAWFKFRYSFYYFRNNLKCGKY